LLYYISMKTKTTPKLTKAQNEAWNKILNHEILNPDEAYSQVYSPPTDYTVTYDSGSTHTWYAKFVYGTFNTATLKALEKKGLIKIHFIGGSYNSDIIEILT